jgi:hypothetical protein
MCQAKEAYPYAQSEPVKPSQTLSNRLKKNLAITMIPPFRAVPGENLEL